MKKSFLWLVVVLLCVSMIAAFSLAGCKEEAEEVAPAEEEAVAGEEVAEEVAPEVTEGEPVNLIFWDFGVYGISYLEQGKEKEEWYISKAIKRFEDKNPGITVELSYQEGPKTLEMLTAAAMSKSGPDIVSMWGGVYVTCQKDGLLVLNDYFTPEEIAAVQGWHIHALGDKYYGAPITSSATCIYYNKSIFKAAGIDPENDYDGTYDGFLALCEKFKNAGITPLINGVSDGWGLSFLEGSIFASQLTPGTVEKTLSEIIAGEKNFATTPEMVAAFQACQDLNTKGYYNDDVTTINNMEAMSLFVNGAGAMFPGVSQDLLGLRDALGEDLGALPMPSLKADSLGFGAAVGGIGLNALVATNYGKHPVESTNFLRFMRTYEEEKEFIEATGYLPCVEGDYSDVLIDPLQDYFINLTNVPVMLDNLMPGNVADTWWSLEPVMLSNQMSVLEFLEAMDSARDEALAASD